MRRTINACLIKGAKKFFLPVIIINIFIFFPSQGKAENIDSRAGIDPEPDEGVFIFLPEVSLLMDGSYLTANGLDYTSSTHRAFSIDILRRGRYVFSTYINEEIAYRERGDNKYDPWIIHYDMDYFSLRMEFSRGSLYYFMDHLCNNIINQEDIGPRELRWYGAGLRWETHGLKIARRNKGLALNNSGLPALLNNFNFMISAVQKISNGYTEQFKYDMFIKGIFRYDLFFLYNMIPYVEGTFRAIIDEGYKRVRYDRSAEGGVRINYNSVDITPFYKYAFRNDTEIYNGTSIDYHSFGLRMETILFDHTGKAAEAENPPLFFPEVHFLGQYAKYLTAGPVNVNHLFNVDVDLIKIENFSIYINNGLRHDSAGQGGLFPRYMDVYAEGGMAYWFEKADILAEPFYRYERLDDGNQYRGYRQRFQAAGLRVGSRNMKTGYVNRGIDFRGGPDGWLSRFGWQVFGGRTVSDLNYPYKWDWGICGRWDIMKYKFTIPYIKLQARELRGEITVREFSVETGARLYDEPAVTLFHDYTRRTETDVDNGLEANRFMLGLRVEI